MTNRITAISAALLAMGGLAACSSGAASDGRTEVDLPAGLDREDLEIVIREYILENPEIIPEAMERLQQNQQAELVSAVHDELVTPFEGAWAGSANPDVTIVQFFDYACGYCRTSLPDIERLLREDDSLRIVFRELPILSEESRTAARVSLSAARQGEFFDFHRAMYGAGRPGAASIAQAQAEAGLDAGRVRSDVASEAVEQEIRNNLELAGSLQLSGTPAFIVGDQILAGAVGYDRLKEAIDQVRANRG